METTPRANRLHIGIFGRRNAGKSSLINALTNQDIALVSDHPGTTTDPVYKAMELLPIGPVVLIDTAGLDDLGEIGQLRVERTMKIFRKTDLAILVVDGMIGWEEPEQKLYEQIKENNLPLIIVINKGDLRNASLKLPDDIKDSLLTVSSSTGSGIKDLKEKMIEQAPEDFFEQRIIGDLLEPGDLTLLVIPIDKAAPKGRLILPQVQTLRDILDSDAYSFTCKENQVAQALTRLKEKPKMVVTDSQAFDTVAEQTPDDILLTSFSILYARYKGDLESLVEGVQTVETLKEGDKVLIAEGCTHHRQSDDIGKVKIPRWLNQKAGGGLEFEWVSGTGFPEDLKPYSLIVHCGSCMLNRKEMVYRINKAKDQGVPIVNYGVFIAYIHGILDRALEPFDINF